MYRTKRSPTNSVGLKHGLFARSITFGQFVAALWRERGDSYRYIIYDPDYTQTIKHAERERKGLGHGGGGYRLSGCDRERSPMWPGKFGILVSIKIYSDNGRAKIQAIELVAQ